MIVKIEDYSQTKGKGIYSADGVQTSFTYKQFANEKMIPPGEYAKLDNGILSPSRLSWFVKLIIRIKEWINGYRRG